MIGINEFLISSSTRSNNLTFKKQIQNRDQKVFCEVEYTVISYNISIESSMSSVWWLADCKSHIKQNGNIYENRELTLMKTIFSYIRWNAIKPILRWRIKILRRPKNKLDAQNYWFLDFNKHLFLIPRRIFYVIIWMLEFYPIMSSKNGVSERGWLFCRFSQISLHMYPYFKFFFHSNFPN